ncbi:unnamed protein product, partial [Durusdinium trenchii]
MGRSGVVEKNICQNICPKGKVELREGKIHASIITIQDETICKKMPSVEASYKWILQMMQVPEDPKAAARAAAEAAVPQEGLAALPPPPKPVMSLELAQDITSQMLTPAVEFGPPVPFSTVLLQKGAVASFAAWQTKYPAIIGLLLGKVQKGRVECWKIVTSTSDSLLSLMQHKKIRRVCRESSINTIGMIQGPELDRERTLENLKILEQDSISCPTC